MSMTSRERLRTILTYMVGILPLPFGAFSTDSPGLVTISLLLFVLLSFAVPLLIRRRRFLKNQLPAWQGLPFLVYGRIIGMMVGLSLLNGVMEWTAWQAYGTRLILYFLWMAAVVAAQYALSAGFSFWYGKWRHLWYSDFLDPLVLALPFPCALLGMFLFPGMSGTSEGGANLFAGLMAVISGFFILTGLLVLMTFAFYFYPSKQRYPSGTQRWPHFLRILVMGGLWLGIHFFLFQSSHAGILGQVFFMFLPIWQSNVLVFVTPFIFEAAVITVAVAMGNVVLFLCQRHS